jgi:sugar phosphate isomerase/epimerase
MSIQDLLEICAKLNFDAVDLTGYYFSGYPEPPADKEIYAVKRRAFLLGLDISGTGVRNDFTTSDEGKLQSDIDLVKRWMQVAVKLGAPVVRVFPGRELEVGQRKETVYRQVARALQECSEFGKKLGVLTVVQNHNGLLKTGADVLDLLGMVRSDWVALNLDIGSYRTADPYRDIRMTAPWAVTWQIKEHVYYGDQKVETNLDRIVQILHEVGYRGYIPLETLEGDPHQRMPILMAKVVEALRRVDPATKN